jgi:hypothetical protein
MGIARLLLFSWQYPWHLRTLGDHPSHRPSTLFEDEDEDDTAVLRPSPPSS